jgi:hypothetical protein
VKLHFIRPLYERGGPYASVYLSGLNEEDRERHWHSLRHDLEEVDRRTLGALEEAALRPVAGQALFAADGEVALAESLSAPPAKELGVWSDLPHITPLLEQRGENVPHLEVIVDHAGAEVTVFGAGSPRRTTVEAESWPLQKTGKGGWAQKRYERAVDESWERNAEAAAREIDEQVRRIGAELIVVAGEPKSRSLLMDHMGTQAADRTVMVEHGSREDHGGFERDVANALDDWLERRRADLLDRHRRQDGPSGLAATANALREGRVQAVLTPGELPEDIWIGAGGTQLGVDPAELRRWGVREPVRERADAAVARAASVTDAELWFCPEVAEVSAVLRY